jgi:hypothetical protein
VLPYLKSTVRRLQVMDRAGEHRSGEVFVEWKPGAGDAWAIAEQQALARGPADMVNGRQCTATGEGAEPSWVTH